MSVHYFRIKSLKKKQTGKEEAKEPHAYENIWFVLGALNLLINLMHLLNAFSIPSTVPENRKVNKQLLLF